MRGARMNRGTVEGSIASGSESHTSPMWLLATLLFFGFLFFVGSLVQITGTEQAVYNLLQSNYIALPGMTAQQLWDIQHNSLNQIQLIATVIGWGVQAFMLMAAFPSEHFITPGLARGRRFVMALLIGGDVLTDAVYVLSGHQIFNGFGFAPGGFGIVIVALVYPIAVCGVTVYCGIELAHRADRLLSLFRLF